MTEFQELPRGNEMLATMYPNLSLSHLVCLVKQRGAIFQKAICRQRS